MARKRSIPSGRRNRTLAVRGFNVSGMMTGWEIVAGTEVQAAIERHFYQHRGGLPTHFYPASRRTTYTFILLPRRATPRASTRSDSEKTRSGPNHCPASISETRLSRRAFLAVGSEHSANRRNFDSSGGITGGLERVFDRRAILQVEHDANYRVRAGSTSVSPE